MGWRQANPLIPLNLISDQALSGFVIAASSIGRAPRDFLIGRALRLLPMLWLSVLIGFTILALLGVPASTLFARGARSATLWPFGNPLDPVVWTLQVEAIFYLMVWCLLIFAEKWIETALIALAVVLATASLVNLSIELAGHNLGNLIPMLLLLRHGGFFALGILIRASTAGRKRLSLWIALATLSCGLEILSIMAARNLEAGTHYTPLVALTVFAFATAVVWYGAAHLKTSVSKAVRTAGLMTYPIYLLHQTVGGATIALALTRLHLPFPAAILLGYLTVLGTSWAMVVFVEPKLRPHFSWLLKTCVPRRPQGLFAKTAPVPPQ
ncbi:acyltransferase family protein [Sphingomonas sp. HH69]